MAAIDYPDTLLPGPLVKGSGHVETDRLLRTEMDTGYAVVRKRFTRVPVDFTVQLLLSQGQLGFFQSWFAGTIDYGASWFKLDGNRWRVDAKIEAIELNLGLDYDVVMQGVISTLGGFESASTYFDKFNVAINTTFPSSGYGPNV